MTHELETQYLKPTAIPDEFRDALDWILHILRREDFDDFARTHADENFFDALETVRCHLVGIPTEAPAPIVRGEGWSL
jgi:hypothetical protein